MREQPSASELIQAVTDFLREDALQQLGGLTAFHARVAISVLDIVRRELELGPQAEARERARLAALLKRDGDLESLNRELCARIARGELTAQNAELMRHLLATASDKLAVDQPGYSTFRRMSAGSRTGTIPSSSWGAGDGHA